MEVVQPIPILKTSDTSKLVRSPHCAVNVHCYIFDRVLKGEGPRVTAAKMPMIKDGDRRLIFRVTNRSLGFVALHHRHSFMAECRAQTIHLSNRLRNTRRAVSEDIGLRTVRIRE